MSSLSTPFHKIWIEQYAASEDIRQQFGLKNALDYLIGEKLFTFVMASEQDSEFAAELPVFVAAIRRLFAPEEIREYLNHLERTKYLAPPEPDLERNNEERRTRSRVMVGKPYSGRGRAVALFSHPATPSVAEFQVPPSETK